MQNMSVLLFIFVFIYLFTNGSWGIFWCKHNNNVVKSLQCDVAQVLCEWLSQPEDGINSARKKNNNSNRQKIYLSINIKFVCFSIPEPIHLCAKIVFSFKFCLFTNRLRTRRENVFAQKLCSSYIVGLFIRKIGLFFLCFLCSLSL